MPVTASTLAEALALHTRESELCVRLPDARVRCVACGHRCVIPPGREGICRVRFNREGRLLVPYGYVAGLALDPVEKKPFYHVLPGSGALSFGMLGCDLHCAYCQNWVSSQSLRDPLAGAGFREVEARFLVETALAKGARLLTSTYNEPLITAEWAAEVFRLGQQEGLIGSFVSNGNATPEVLDFLAGLVQCFKVDLKCFDDRGYRSLGGTLEAVLRSIRSLHHRGVWVEVVTLVVPGLSDDPGELLDLAQFLVSVSADIPWHVTAFHADYRMNDRVSTSASTLLRAAEIGRNAGLRFVYAGNLPGLVGRWEDTTCPSCQATVVERRGFRVLKNRIAQGRCPECSTAIPGVWTSSRHRETAASGT
jgi:pyruvate formate lyase activating enzyme